MLSKKNILGIIMLVFSTLFTVTKTVYEYSSIISAIEEKD